MNYYSNMCRYDTRGRRLAIFGQIEERGSNKMMITILTCSKKDQFSRKIAHGIYKLSRNLTVVNYHGLTPHPEEFEIILENPSTPKKEFLKFVNENYYRIMRIAFPFKGLVMDVDVEKEKMDMHGRKSVIVKYLGK
jgi:hypothetical protein